MNPSFELLVEMDAPWADMLMQILQDNSIFCRASPVFGAGMVMCAGVKERMKIYVPAECKLEAEELMNAFFSENSCS